MSFFFSPSVHSVVGLGNNCSSLSGERLKIVLVLMVTGLSLDNPHIS